ncbi:30S ribosomal protein S16 [Rhodobacteraceae bacterium Araon29]
MAMKIRLARGGSKKRPFYRIVAADSRMPRDGRYVEKLGTYNPLLAKDSEDRVKMNLERIQYWLGEGAQVSDRVSRMLEAAGVLEKKTRNNPQKAVAGQKMQERAEEKAAKAAEAAEAPAEPVEEVAEAPAEAEAEAPAEAEAEAPAEAAEAPAEEVPAEAEAEAPAEEAPAEEAAAEDAEK